MNRVAAVVKGKIAGMVSRWNDYDRCYPKSEPKTQIIWGNK